MKRLLIVIVLLSFWTYTYSQEEKVNVRRNSIWNSKIIPVCWENPTDENSGGRTLVEEAITQSWERVSGLEFTNWGECNQNSKGVRILIADEGPHTKGLGNKLDGVKNGMVLNFTFDNWSQSCKHEKDFCIKAISIHEFGHGIGFAHEQNRDDCNFENCLGEEQGTKGDWYITTCDTFSIMNYCNPNWNNDGFLSKLDSIGAVTLYGLPKGSVNDVLDINYTVKRIKKRWIVKFFDTFRKKPLSHRFIIYITTSDKLLSTIEKVKFKLPPKRFKNNEMISTNSKNKFSISLKVRSELSIDCEIQFKNEELKTIHKDLKFN